MRLSSYSGGDEFAAVLLDADAELAEAVAARLTETLIEPFALDSVTVPIDASIGIALANEHATDARTLVSCADLAMYRAKTGHKPYAMYESSFADAGDQLRLVEELADALQNGELFLSMTSHSATCGPARRSRARC